MVIMIKLFKSACIFCLLAFNLIWFLISKRNVPKTQKLAKIHKNWHDQSI